MFAISSIKESLDAALGLFYPNVCQMCREQRAAFAEGYVCDACRERGVKQITDPFCAKCGAPYAGEIPATFFCSHCAEMELHFETARAAVVANAFVREVIHRYKYSRNLWFEPFLVRLLLERATPEVTASKFDLIVPIPLHARRQREREFNQAERLARALARATGLPVASNILKRVLETETQTRLTRKERTENVKKAFAWSGQSRLKGERVVLIDDVLTTGATASACAKVLRENGAGEVRVWTVARARLK